MPLNGVTQPSVMHAALGRDLRGEFPGSRAILESAERMHVPVLTPAFHDSEVGNDVYVWNRRREQRGLPSVTFDLERDTILLVEHAAAAERLGIFSVGGGTPRNYLQNAPPLIEIIRERGVGEMPLKKFAYGCRIDPAPNHFGNLGGATYSEGKSWRKMGLNGRFSAVRADATIVWPFMLKYVLEQL